MAQRKRAEYMRGYRARKRAAEPAPESLAPPAPEPEASELAELKAEVAELRRELRRVACPTCRQGRRCILHDAIAAR